MNFNFARHFVIRMPVGSPGGYANGRQFFLDDPNFRAALLIASTSFYAILARRNFQAAELLPKEELSLQKYINRYCFRPTPFGLFASVSLIEWSNAPTGTSFPMYRPHFHADMAIQQALETEILTEYDLLEHNPSIYRVMNEYRFLTSFVDNDTGDREYQLQSMGSSALLTALIRFCKNERTRQEIVAYTVDIAACSQEEAVGHTNFLIDERFLVHTLRTNITGEDHWERSVKKIKSGPLKNRLFQVCRSFSTVKTDIPSTADILEQERTLISVLPGPQEPQRSRLNVILQRLESGTLPEKIQDELRDALTALGHITPSRELPSMSRFVKEFIHHFDGQMVPLLKALDPETGIGYQLPGSEKYNPLLETLHVKAKVIADHDRAWSDVHALLLEVWLRDKSAVPVIKLDRSELNRSPAANTQKPISGMSVLFRVTDEHIIIENAGGVNAPALLGRFTVLDEPFRSAAEEMARYTEVQNPDLIFAELLHLTDPHTDNVNRRAHVYRYELPITASSTLPKDQQVELSDLFLVIHNGQVWLFSKKHQKFVIPRSTSAYNHQLNRLPLFRFLADLPYQYSCYDLSFDLRQYFPKLSFYPRVLIGEVIIALATWILNKDMLAMLQVSNEEVAFANFLNLCEEIKLPRYFILSENDQELVFDQALKREVAFFLRCIRQKKEVVLKEYLNQGPVKQYNAFLLPTQKLDGPQLTHAYKKTRVQRKHIPGSEWLYLKIYTPKLGANSLLLRVRSLLKRRYGQSKITRWFFIRYQDPAPHIRLRLMVAQGSITEVLLAFKTKLEGHIHQHIIREYQIDVYTRELERYAAGGIEDTEELFFTSSELVMHFLEQNKATVVVSTPVFALYTLKIIIETFFSNIDDQIAFALNSYQQFLSEFDGVKISVELDKKYRELAGSIEKAFRREDPGMLSGSVIAGQRFVNSLKTIRQNIAEQPFDAYLRSIGHMHLNRIFADEPRKQEMICYYLLYKKLASDKGRNSKTNL